MTKMKTGTNRTVEELEEIVQELELANRQLGNRLIELDAGSTPSSGINAARKLAQTENALTASNRQLAELREESDQLRGQVAALQAQVDRSSGLLGLIRRVRSRLSRRT